MPRKLRSSKRQPRAVRLDTLRLLRLGIKQIKPHLCSPRVPNLWSTDPFPDQLDNPSKAQDTTSHIRDYFAPLPAPDGFNESKYMAGLFEKTNLTPIQSTCLLFNLPGRRLSKVEFINYTRSFYFKTCSFNITEQHCALLYGTYIILPRTRLFHYLMKYYTQILTYLVRFTYDSPRLAADAFVALLSDPRTLYATAVSHSFAPVWQKAKPHRSRKAAPVPEVPVLSEGLPPDLETTASGKYPRSTYHSDNVAYDSDGEPYFDMSLSDSPIIERPPTPSVVPPPSTSHLTVPTALLPNPSTLSPPGTENPVEALHHYLSCIAALRQAYPDVREVMDILQDVKCEPSDFVTTFPETQSPDTSFGSIFDAVKGDSLYLGAFALSFTSALFLPSPWSKAAAAIAIACAVKLALPRLDHLKKVLIDRVLKPTSDVSSSIIAYWKSIFRTCYSRLTAILSLTTQVSDNDDAPPYDGLATIPLSVHLPTYVAYVLSHKVSYPLQVRQQVAKDVVDPVVRKFSKADDDALQSALIVAWNSFVKKRPSEITHHRLAFAELVDFELMKRNARRCDTSDMKKRVPAQILTEPEDRKSVV